MLWQPWRGLMRSAKEIEIKALKKSDVDFIIKKNHYSGRTCQNSQVNFGVFLDGKIIGGLQYGPSIDKRRTGPTIGCGMNDYLELNRMAIADVGIKNIESRAISITLNILKKTYPFLKAILSFADACQCGDGTIYRASGFKLVAINKNKSLLKIGDDVIASKSLDDYQLSTGEYLSSFIKKIPQIVADKSLNDIKLSNGKSLTSAVVELGAKPLIGYQFKYVFYFDKELEKKQKFIPFDQIPKECRMYLGKNADEAK